EDKRTYIVTEVCPHCENEVEMRWDTDTKGFRAFCPHCGKRLMLCDECMHTEGCSACDYDARTDSCHHNRAHAVGDRVRLRNCPPLKADGTAYHGSATDGQVTECRSCGVYAVDLDDGETVIVKNDDME
ncbi:MAG: phage terminase large subunit family protein, partial [Ruminococcus flavefaciens]|nr:phage terminase large subunit family protein [Ruminococcus flavefaciens]